MQADRSESKAPGSRPQVGARFWALPVAVAAVLAMGPVQADPVPDGGPLTSGYGYDAEGNLTTVNLPKGTGQADARQNTHGYDSLGRRTSSKLAAPAAGASAPELGFGYDGLDQLKKVTDPRKLDTTYTTSGLGNTTTQGSPDTGTTQVTYYPDGRVWTVTDSRSKVSTFEYDDLGRLTKISYSAGKASQFEYDGGVLTSNNSTGQLSKLTDESGYTAYTHDGLGRVLTKTQTVGTANQKFTLKQTWGDTGTAVGKLQSQTYPSKAQLNYTYDAAGRLQSITLNPVKADGSGTKLTQTIPLLGDITYDALSQVKNWTWGGGVAYTRSFDTQGRLSTYPLGNPFGTGNAAGLIRTMGYDDAGRIVSYTHTNGSGTSKPAFNQSFNYDGLDRLKQQQLAASNFAYDYDLSNNRTSQTLGGTTYANTIAADSNRLMKERNGQGTTTFTYDNAGNLKTDGTNTFTYSARGRLASVAMAGDTVSYLYNALDQRVLKTGPTSRVNSGSRYYAYDEQGHLIGDYDADGSPGTYGYEVVYLGDTPVAVINQTRTLVNGALNIVTNVSYVYADHIDTPRVIARSSDHAIQWRWDLSEAFGNAQPNDNPNALGAYTFNLRFPGQTYDKEAGLSYNHHRDYRAQSGRYAESDPIGLAGGVNTYVYVNGGPLQGTDPLGLFDSSGIAQTTRQLLPAAPAVVPLVTTPAGIVVGAVGGAGIVGAGLGMGINYSFEAIAGNSIGSTLYDLIHASSDPDLQRAIESSANYHEYKRACGYMGDINFERTLEQAGAGWAQPDKCEVAKRLRDRVKQCKAFRKANTDKWHGGVDDKHDPKTHDDIDRRLRNAEDLVKRFCKEPCP